MDWINLMRFQVLTAASMKSIVLWDITSCSLVEVDLRFRGAYCLHFQGDDDRPDNGRNERIMGAK
jgi:hypothetical protein